ncbi:hypothetical protein J6590_032273 [Homalodisca vitripennis]|nr:hypothetical protein J6590_032273 [Homalodisca vitripennis]
MVVPPIFSRRDNEIRSQVLALSVYNAPAYFNTSSSRFICLQRSCLLEDLKFSLYLSTTLLRTLTPQVLALSVYNAPAYHVHPYICLPCIV